MVVAVVVTEVGAAVATVVVEVVTVAAVAATVVVVATAAAMAVDVAPAWVGTMALAMVRVSRVIMPARLRAIMV